MNHNQNNTGHKSAHHPMCSQKIVKDFPEIKVKCLVLYLQTGQHQIFTFKKTQPANVFVLVFFLLKKDLNDFLFISMVVKPLDLANFKKELYIVCLYLVSLVNQQNHMSIYAEVIKLEHCQD